MFNYLLHIYQLSIEIELYDQEVSTQYNSTSDFIHILYLYVVYEKTHRLDAKVY